VTPKIEVKVAGYSGTPLWKKLGMKPGARWAVIDGPHGFDLHDRPDSEPSLAKFSGVLDGCLVFCTSQRHLDRAFDGAAKCLRRDGGVWIAWPKKSSSLPSSIAFDEVQGTGLARGLVDNKVCAIDDDWSGLRFVVRVADRASWPR
jgi:hypothetical protein